MDIICPLDVQFADQIAVLLAPPSPQALQDYFNQLIATRRYDGLKIKQCGEFGKGVYADLEFKEGELILKDQMLVGAQHVSNKVESLVCGYCFCYIGSIELQIGRKLYLQGLGEDVNMGVDHQTLAHTSREVCPINLLGKGEGNTDHDNLRSFASSESKDNILPPKEIIESLINGELSLPYSKHFPLPPIISCAGGCGEEQYCSKSCAEADWESFHSLVCSGGSSGSTRMEALARFMEHANETNDIFLLAAKAISSTILKYEKLKAASLEQQTQPNTMEHFNFYVLLEAWKPLSMGFKKRWWDCVAVPTDIDHHEEATFRAQIKELAFTSLQLLKEAIFIKDCAPLFSLEIYGHIIGMFELNNLDLVVASPVEDYFIYIDDLPCPEKEEAEKSTRPFLKALGDDYSVCCQGTAFFPLQSCMNHSCCPNAKAFKRDEDRDGQATIIALRPISKGEEITISYIDEDLPYEERQALLEDYGFRCKCPKCVEEEA